MLSSAAASSARAALVPLARSHQGVGPVLQQVEAGGNSIQPGQPAAGAAPLLIKLNGGLGTSMGLSKAKSLLPVKGNMTFLDIITRQVLIQRAQSASNASYYL